MSPARDDLPEFHCPDWPSCLCPDGAVHPDCPGLGRRPARVVEFRSVPRPSAAIDRPARPGFDAGRQDFAKPMQRRDLKSFTTAEGASATAPREDSNPFAEPYRGEPDGFTPREVTVLVALTLACGIALGGGTAVMTCIGGWL